MRRNPRVAQIFVLSRCIHFASLYLQAIASDIGLGHGLPSLHTLFTCPRRLLQGAAGVFIGGCANQVHVEQAFNPETWFEENDPEGVAF